MNTRGAEILHVSKMTTKRPIIANSSDILSLDNDARNVIELESQSTDVYSLFLPIPQPCGRDWTAGICKIRDNMQLPFQHDSVSLRGLRKNKFSFKGRVILLELKEIDFENYGKCVQLSNGVIDVVVTIDCGPRIVRFGFVGGENVLYNDLERKYKMQNAFMDDYYSEGAACYFYGGHRLWLAPEKMPESYFPDNDPVIYALLPDGVTFSSAKQKQNEVQTRLKSLWGKLL